MLTWVFRCHDYITVGNVEHEVIRNTRSKENKNRHGRCFDAVSGNNLDKSLIFLYVYTINAYIFLGQFFLVHECLYKKK